ncbi:MULTISPECIES: hypothetical protein [unclassified Moorena]|nr:MULTISPECIES: hypothetical protein [unclassified Moorena]
MRYTLFLSDSRFPIPDSRFSIYCSLFPKTENSVPHKIKNRYILG